jgi:hypothetical protein
MMGEVSLEADPSPLLWARGISYGLHLHQGRAKGI